MKRSASVNQGFLFFLIPVLFLIFWEQVPAGRLADLGWRDFLYTMRENRASRVKDILIVAIDEPSFQQIGQQWPWPRSLHGKVVRSLKEAGAAAVVFDVLFLEPSRDAHEDQAFAQALEEAGNVVLGANFTKVGRQNYETYFVEEPVAALAKAAARVGLVNFFPDSDGSIRMGFNQIYGRKTIAPYAIDTAFGFRSPDNIVPREGSGAFCIDYAGKNGSFPVVSYYQVLDQMVSPEIFRNKIVLIGFQTDASVEVESGADTFPTPFLRFSNRMMFGVEIHANIINTILQGYPVTSPWMPWKWALFSLMAQGLFYIRKHPVHLMVCTLAGIAVLSAASVFLFRGYGVFFDALPGSLAVTLNGLFLGVSEFRVSYREKSMLRKAFDSYVAPDVVDGILKNHGSLKLGGEKKRLSILFSDIRGFTAMSERYPPEELVRFLNQYLDHMTRVVFAHQGTLDKFIGDALMVIFGAPVDNEQHADQACLAALAMQDALKRMNQKNRESDLPLLTVGIGINTGEMIVGNMGSERRFDYTVIGDEVNLASRLEGVTKYYRVRILIAEETRRAVGSRFACRELDLIRVKGREKPIRIYELMGEEPLPRDRAASAEAYSKGLEAYREQAWDIAVSCFQEAGRLWPGDGPSGVFIKRCQEFTADPPGKDWNSVWTMMTK